MSPEAPIRCVTLHATVPARCCILRQAVARTGRTLQASRGQGTTFPSCDGCRQGAKIRAAIDGADRITWRGAGPGHRFEREGIACAQLAARRRLELVGALGPVPTIDTPAAPDPQGA